jgi:hypothetical protein
MIISSFLLNIYRSLSSFYFVRALRHLTCAVIATAVVGCASTSIGPTRLYSTSSEGEAIRTQIGLPDFAHYMELSDSEAVRYRNNYIGARMYAMDVAYSDYEASITKENQWLGFGSTIATLGLTGASTLVPAVATKDILTTAAGGIAGSEAAYNDQLLMKQTVSIIQNQMRANRSNVAAGIMRKMSSNSSTYTLGMALSDLEEYYRAGTITGGVLGASASAGQAATDASANKDNVTVLTLARDTSEMTLRSYLYPAGISAGVSPDHKMKVIGILKQMNVNTPWSAVLESNEYASVRNSVLARARALGYIK